MTHRYSAEPSAVLHPVSSMHAARIVVMGLAGLLAIAGAAQAQERPAQAAASPGTTDPSRIAEVKLYPGVAAVERVARVGAASRSITFACLPDGLDVQSLQVWGDASVRIGETAVARQPRTLVPECANLPLDARIRELEEQHAGLQAESDALDLVTGYLRSHSAAEGSTAAAGGRGAADPRSMAAMADALRRTAHDALQKQQQLKRRQAELDRQMAPLQAERKRIRADDGQVRSVTVNLAATRDTEVRMSYQISGPGWTPTYRALLDTATGRLKLERQAQVAQDTGEDWRGVKLLLSTGQPRRETTGREPAPWRIGIEPPPLPRSTDRSAMYGASSAAPVAMAMARPESAAQQPLFDAAVFNNSFATEFRMPQAVDVPSGGQRVTLALGQHEETVRVAVRTSPRVDASAFLIAELAPPEGVWPPGPLQLYRDGDFVGSGRWMPATRERITLSFGRDELVRVLAEPERDSQGTTGLIGQRAERQVQRAFVVENRHRMPIAVEVLEAAPVSVDEQVRIAMRFEPEPAERDWQKQPGLVKWAFDLPAGQSRRLAADYTIGYPKDARLELR